MKEITIKNQRGAGRPRKKKNTVFQIYAFDKDLLKEIKSNFTPDEIRAIIINAFNDELNKDNIK